MQGLNDFDEKITEKEFIVELLHILDEEFQYSFYGFYLNFIKVSLIRIKSQNKVSNNLIEILKILLKVLLFNVVKLVPQRI